MFEKKDRNVPEIDEFSPEKKAALAEYQRKLAEAQEAGFPVGPVPGPVVEVVGDYDHPSAQNCADCGKVVGEEADRSKRADELPICETCEEDYIQCPYCEEWGLKEDYDFQAGPEGACQVCADIMICSTCGEEVRRFSGLNLWPGFFCLSCIEREGRE